METNNALQLIRKEMPKDLIINGKKYEVINPQLKEQLITYTTADQLEKGLNWSKAYAYFNIVNDKLYEGEFKELDTLDKLIDISDKIKRQYTRVVPIREQVKELDGALDLSINCIDGLGSLIKDDLLDKFIKYLKSRKITTFSGLSERKFYELKKAFLDKIARNEKAENEENENEKEELNEKEEEFVNIEYNDKMFSIPYSVLKDYEVIEG